VDHLARLVHLLDNLHRRLLASHLTSRALRGLLLDL